MLFGTKIVKTEILAQNGTLLASAERNFVFPKNLESSEESILIIKERISRSLSAAREWTLSLTPRRATE